jgi:hypothetical protein
MIGKSDKRTFNRIKISNMPLEYKIADCDGVFKAEVINLSAGGVCFLRTSILAEGDIIQLKFKFEASRIILKGEVIRIEGREAGVKFIDDEMAIEKFVECFNNEYSRLKTKPDWDVEENGVNGDQKEDFKNMFDSNDD